MKSTITRTGGTLLAALCFCLPSLPGATLILNDGSRIEGTLKKIHNSKVYFETGFAGTLEIPQDKVQSLESTSVMNLRTTEGEVFQGPVAGTGDGTLLVESNSGSVETQVAEVASAWESGARDPQVVANERKWGFSALANISGSNGNSENFLSSLRMEAELAGPKDRLLLYGSYKYKESEGVRSEDEQKVGMKYNSYFGSNLGWYVREELERDAFEGIDFRSTTGGGLSYTFIDEDRLNLEGMAGFSYRYESYSDSSVEDDGFPGLDFGLDLDWQFADWGKLVSSLRYLPSVDDFADYLIEHETSVNLPLKQSDNWVLRFGVANQYNSSPSGSREKMDTTYFAGLILLWE